MALKECLEGGFREVTGYHTNHNSRTPNDSPGPQGETRSNETFIHHKIRRADGMIGVDNQFIVIQVPARLPIHLIMKMG